MDIKYVITVDSTGAVKNVQDFDKAIEALGKGTDTTKGKSQSFGNELTSKLIPAFTAASLAASAIQGILRGVKNVMVGIVGAAIEQEDADRALRASLELTGRTVAGNYEHYKKFAEAQQLVTKYSDDEVQAAQNLLLQMTRLDQQGIDRATKGAMGLASVFKMDLQSAASLVQKAMEGNFGALGRYGIRVRESGTLDEKRADLLEQLEGLYGRATAATGTFSGKVGLLKNAWGEAQEEIGKAITQNKGVQALLQKVTEIIRDITPEIKEYTQGLAAFISGIASVVKATLQAIKDVRQEVGGVHSVISEEAAAWDRLNEKMGGFSNVSAAVIGQLNRMQQYSKDNKPVLDALWASFNEIGGKATLAAIAAGKFGKEVQDAFRVVGGESLKVAESLGLVKGKVDEVGDASRIAGQGSSEAAKKLQQAIQGLIDQADPLRAQYRGILDDMALMDAAYKTGKVSTTNYGKVMDWLQAQLRYVTKPIITLGTTELPKISREMQKLIDLITDPKNIPKPFFSDWKDDLQEFGTKAEAVMSKVQEVATQVFGQLDAIAAQSQKNKEIALDNEYQKRLEVIKATVTNEEEQRAAIEALDAEYDIKRRSLQHSAAKQQKAASLAQAIINVAEGVSKALAQGGIFGPILAAAVLAMGAIQIKLISQQPIPFREGNVFSRLTTMYTPGGRQVQMGEEEPEILAPESKLRKIMREEIGRAGGGGAGQPQTAAIYLDGKRVGQALMPAFSQLSKRGRGGTSVRTLTRSET